MNRQTFTDGECQSLFLLICVCSHIGTLDISKSAFYKSNRLINTIVCFAFTVNSTEIRVSGSDCDSYGWSVSQSGCSLCFFLLLHLQLHMMRLIKYTVGTHDFYQSVHYFFLLIETPVGIYNAVKLSGDV